MKQNNALVLGVTGGIGSGKSTVSSILSTLGASVIDADLISRQIVEPGEKALIELTESFGKDILDECGHLNRKLLADLIFNDRQKLDLTNSIMHKHVAERIKTRIDESKLSGSSVIVIDVPIPIKHGFLDQSDIVWTVVSSLENRIERIRQRSGMTREEAMARINAQIPEQQYISIADTIIYNDGNLESLTLQVEVEFNKLIG